MLWQNSPGVCDDFGQFLLAHGQDVVKFHHKEAGSLDISPSWLVQSTSSPEPGDLGDEECSCSADAILHSSRQFAWTRRTPSDPSPSSGGAPINQANRSSFRYCYRKGVVLQQQRWERPKSSSPSRAMHYGRQLKQAVEAFTSALSLKPQHLSQSS